MPKQSLKLVMIALLLATVCAAAATAATTFKATQITIKDKGLTFSGKVSANDPVCISGRKVTLHRTNGNVLGTYTTQPSGQWKITASGSAGITLGHFYATVARKTVGTLFGCKAARSRTISYHR